MGVNEVPAVNTPDRHPRPLERAREKRRERLAQEESQRNRDLLQSVRAEDSASRCKLEPVGACLVCKKVVAECDWDEWSFRCSPLQTLHAHCANCRLRAIFKCPNCRASGAFKNQQSLIDRFNKSRFLVDSYDKVSANTAVLTGSLSYSNIRHSLFLCCHVSHGKGQALSFRNIMFLIEKKRRIRLDLLTLRGSWGFNIF